jgi:prostaglandin-endoperoxide synthase 2
MFFAQWFTDSILRIDPRDRRKNTSNHNIDLCQIYGRKETTARLLRSKEKSGKLASQMINGEEYLDYLGEVGADGKWKVKKDYENLPYAAPEIMHVVFGDWPEERKHKLYATGLERGNSSVGYVAISTVFMREHNRICDELSARNPDWDGDDERLFQTARMINNVILMKLVVQDYINHIAGKDLFTFYPSFADKEEWYRTPWIALEFDLLYRWHGLVPDDITVGGRTYDDTEYRVNNALLEKAGLAAIIDAASRQHAGRISLQNVPDFLLGAEYRTIKMGRDFRLRPYNDYRKQFGLDALTSFEQLTDDAALRDRLKAMYGDINKVEFIIGLFAQKHAKSRLYGDLMYAMVAYDALTQIYTNPLLSRNVYTTRTFTQYGLDLIDDTNTVQDLVDRNVAGSVKVGFGF